jgi:hypothetical protein
MCIAAALAGGLVAATRTTRITRLSFISTSFACVGLLTLLDSTVAVAEKHATPIQHFNTGNEGRSTCVLVVDWSN